MNLKCSGCGLAPAGVTHVCPPVGMAFPVTTGGLSMLPTDADHRAAIAALQKALGAAEVRVEELEARLEAHSSNTDEMRGVGIGYTLATGRLFCDISQFHAFAEGLLARSVWTHEFGDHAVWVEMRERFESLVTELGTADLAQSASPLPVPVGPDGEAAGPEANSPECGEVRGKADA